MLRLRKLRRRDSLGVSHTLSFSLKGALPTARKSTAREPFFYEVGGYYRRFLIVSIGFLETLKLNFDRGEKQGEIKALGTDNLL